MSKTRPQASEAVAGASAAPKGANPAPAEDDGSSAAPAKSAGAPIGRKGRGWLVNKAQMISVLGRPVTFIERLVNNGAPTVKHGAGGADTWEFNTADFIAFMIRDALETAGLGNSEMSFEAAKRKDKEAQAKLRELDLLERQGIVVNIEKLRPAFREAFSNTRSRMLSVPSQVIGMTHVQLRQLEDAINDALAELSDPQHWTTLFADVLAEADAAEAVNATAH